MRVDEERGFHFFVSTAAEWRTGTDIEKLIVDVRKSTKKMGFSGLTIMAFYVPVDEKAHYQISQYAPQVEGTIFLGQYK